MSSDIMDEAKPIFDAHVMILDDKSLHEEVTRRISQNRFSAEYAVSRSLRKFEKAFYAIDDVYLAQRVADIQDIERRLLCALLGEKTHELSTINRRVALVAHDLTPTETASLNPDYVVGFATDVGGQTGHAAIVARAMELPAVVGLGTISTDVSSGDTIIIDGNRGIVVIHPDQETLDRYRRMADDFYEFEQALYSEKDLPTVTTDGVEAEVHGNIEFHKEVEQVNEYGGHGVGLYRTEFLYLAQDGHEPTEENHFDAYKAAVEDLEGKPLVIRTLDLGADKFFHKDSSIQERNPSLGCRAIRYCLQRPDIFRTQLRAICRASAFGPIRLMLPMICTRDEVIRTREMIESVQEELASEDIEHDDEMAIGIMVEIPATALMIDSFVDVADFFSIGTNDLIQYTSAVDRTNERVASLYQPAHPAVLRLIREVLDCGQRNERPVSVCGEMCGEPTFVVFLLGLGLRKFSVSPPLIPEVKKLIRSVSLDKAKEVAAHVMTLSTHREITAYLRTVTQEILPTWTFM
jgi:phosphotransferase system enzyme I (PtsI)